MEAVIFDIDGTLLQSDASDDAMFLDAVRAVLGDVRMRPSWGLYTQFTAGGILGEILDDNAIARTSAVTDAVRSHFVAAVERHLAEKGPFAEIPGARAFVQRLHLSDEHEVAYATGGWRGSAHRKLVAAGFPLDGVPLATSEDHAERQGILLRALAQLGGAHDRVTYYGDGPWDEAAALALGWEFVAVGKRLGGLLEFADGLR